MRPGEHSKARRKSQVGAAAALLAVCLSGSVLAAPADEPPFDATADTVFDIIQTSDETQFLCLSDEGRAVRQMWDKRIDGESDLNVFLFTAHFRDGPPIDIILNPEFGTPEAARTEAERYTRALGQLPPSSGRGCASWGSTRGTRAFMAGPARSSSIPKPSICGSARITWRNRCCTRRFMPRSMRPTGTRRPGGTRRRPTAPS